MSSETIILSGDPEAQHGAADRIIRSIHNLDRTLEVQFVSVFAWHLYKKRKAGGMVILNGDHYHGVNLFPRRLLQNDGHEIHEKLRSMELCDEISPIDWESLSNEPLDLGSNSLIDIINDHARSGSGIPKKEYESLPDVHDAIAVADKFKLIAVPVAVKKSGPSFGGISLPGSSEFDRAVKEFEKFIDAVDQKENCDACFLFILYIKDGPASAVSLVKVEDANPHDGDLHCSFSYNPDDYKMKLSDYYWFLSDWKAIEHHHCQDFVKSLKVEQSLSDQILGAVEKVFGTIDDPINPTFLTVKARLDDVASKLRSV